MAKSAILPSIPGLAWPEMPHCPNFHISFFLLTIFAIETLESAVSGVVSIILNVKLDRNNH